MHIVTSGHPSLDIDGYGSCIALAELLRLQGEEAIAASRGRMNATIPPLVLEWKVDFKTMQKPVKDDIFTVVDVSDPNQLDPAVDASHIAEIIDHHPGFEAYWKEQGIQAQLEFVGAACTMVYERWRDAGLLPHMSTTSARLLVCGILDNTLNLKASITTQRDKTAYAQLLTQADLPNNWPQQYFRACQETALKDAAKAILNDLKVQEYPTLAYKVTVGQLALWDAQNFIHSDRETIAAILSQKDLPWFMNLIDLHTGKNVLMCEDADLKAWLAKTLNTVFEGDIATTDRMWLRKEIMKRSHEQSPDTA